MIEFNPKYQRDSLDLIVVAGEVVGEVWQYHDKYQCQLSFGTLRECALSLNGIGSTKEESVEKAIENGREQMRRMAEAVTFLEGNI